MKCPVCGSVKFYVKDPDDEYETYEFEFVDGEIRPGADMNGSELPAIGAGTETFCNQCAWHGKPKS